MQLQNANVPKFKFYMLMLNTSDKKGGQIEWMKKEKN